LMSELWSHEEAKRLYGFISAGGTAGALVGPLLTQGLVRIFAPVDLMLASAALLIASMFASLLLRRLRPSEADSETEPTGGGVLDGAIKVFTTPMFARIALFIFVANIIGTFFYLEQARLVSASINNSADRVLFFSGRDLLVSIVTFLMEVFGTARVLRHFGVTTALLALPVTGALAVLLLSSDAALWIAAAVMVAERIVSFALANPAIKLIYTLATPPRNTRYRISSTRSYSAAATRRQAGSIRFSAAGSDLPPARREPLLFRWLLFGSGRPSVSAPITSSAPPNFPRNVEHCRKR
jgi:ATP:ADP antiporter, AAA family